MRTGFLRKLKANWLRIIVHVGAWLPLIWLVWLYFSDQLTVNPIQAATQRTGKIALILLVSSLACTPLNTIFGFRQALSVRRALGLYAYMYAVLHFLIFTGWDYAFNLSFILLDVSNKAYIWVGLSVLLILTSLAFTSTRGWMKRMGKNWKRLHRLVYLAGGLVILHYAWSKKGDLLSLQGEVLQPAIFGVVVALLLAARLPIVRRTASLVRTRWVARLFLSQADRSKQSSVAGTAPGQG